MTRTIPASHADLLVGPRLGSLATVRPDGWPQNNPTWFDWDGSLLRLSTLDRRQKTQNVAHDPHVSLLVVDPDCDQRYIEIRGDVISVEPDADDEFFNMLVRRYFGLPRSPVARPGASRVIIVIEPTHVNAWHLKIDLEAERSKQGRR